VLVAAPENRRFVPNNEIGRAGQGGVPQLSETKTLLRLSVLSVAANATVPKELIDTRESSPEKLADGVAKSKI